MPCVLQRRLRLHAHAFTILVALAGFALPIGCSTAELTGSPDGGVEDPIPSATSESDAGVDGELDSSSTTADVGVTLPTEDAAVIPSSAKVRILVQPTDDPASLVNALRAATKSIHMTMYMLTANAVEQVLIDKHRAGVDVKVVLNQNFPQGGNANASSFTKLQGAGVSVVWAPAGFRYTHSKSIVIDDAALWVMTMNATETSPTKNREYLAIDTEAADIAQAETIFQADFANRSVTVAGNLLVSPVNSQSKILALLQSAKSTIELEGESLADTRVTDALTKAADSGVKVRVVLSDDTSSTDGELRAIETLKQHNIAPVAVANPYIHAKAIVVDGKRAYVGSINFTNTSFNFNRELGLVTDDATAVGIVQRTVLADVARGTAL